MSQPANENYREDIHPDHGEHKRIAEALLFACDEPLSAYELNAYLPEGADVARIMDELAVDYQGRGITLSKIDSAWAFRTAIDVAPHLKLEIEVPRKMSRAAIETLAIIGYYQPVTRAEIEDVRGVAVSRGTLDILLDQGFIKPGRRKQIPGRPGTWVTTQAFLDHFDLESLKDLPNYQELKEAGFLNRQVPLSHIMDQVEMTSKEEDVDDEQDVDDDENISVIDSSAW